MQPRQVNLLMFSLKHTQKLNIKDFRQFVAHAWLYNTFFALKIALGNPRLHYTIFRAQFSLIVHFYWHSFHKLLVHNHMGTSWTMGWGYKIDQTNRTRFTVGKSKPSYPVPVLSVNLHALSVWAGHISCAHTSTNT